MFRYTLTYVATFVVMLAIDAVWLALTAGPLYRAKLGDMLMQGFRPAPAILFYLLYVGGILIFVVPAGDAPHDYGRVALFGGLFGLFCYATYDLTNFATLKTWPLSLTVADMAWGTALTAVASTIGTFAGDWLLRLLRG
jgi:uncharacterized membrane protein